MELAGPTERAAAHQRMLNARPIPPRHLQRVDRAPIPVTVRVVWERDGVELLEGQAEDWVGRDVLVHVRDARLQVSGVWFDARDVRPR